MKIVVSQIVLVLVLLKNERKEKGEPGWIGSVVNHLYQVKNQWFPNPSWWF